MKYGCFHCDARVRAGEPFCRECGHPTPWASHEERQTWELTQWRSMGSGSGAIATARVHAPTVTVPPPIRISQPRATPKSAPSVATPKPAPVPRRPAVGAGRTPRIGGIPFPRIGALRPAPLEPVVAPQEPPAPAALDPAALDPTGEQLARMVGLLRSIGEKVDAIGARLDGMQARRPRVRDLLWRDQARQ